MSFKKNDKVAFTTTIDGNIVNGTGTVFCIYNGGWVVILDEPLLNQNDKAIVVLESQMKLIS